MEVIKRIETRRGANLSLNGIAEKILDKEIDKKAHVAMLAKLAKDL